MSDDLGLQTRVLRHISGKCLSIADIAAELDMARHQVSHAAARLIERGYMERVDAGCFQLTASGIAACDSGLVIQSGPRGKHKTVRRMPRISQRQRAWNAMRIHRSFTIRDIVTVVARGNYEAAIDNVGRYMRELARAGVLVTQAQREEGVHLKSQGFLRYRLQRDLGPIAPVYSQANDVLHDPNAVQEAARCSSP